MDIAVITTCSSDISSRYKRSKINILLLFEVVTVAILYCNVYYKNEKSSISCHDYNVLQNTFDPYFSLSNVFYRNLYRSSTISYPLFVHVIRKECDTAPNHRYLSVLREQTGDN